MSMLSEESKKEINMAGSQQNQIIDARKMQKIDKQDRIKKKF